MRLLKKILRQFTRENIDSSVTITSKFTVREIQAILMNFGQIQFREDYSFWDFVSVIYSCIEGVLLEIREFYDQMKRCIVGIN